MKTKTYYMLTGEEITTYIYDLIEKKTKLRPTRLGCKTEQDSRGNLIIVGVHFIHEEELGDLLAVSLPEEQQANRRLEVGTL